MSTTADARALVDANADNLERFVRNYLLDNGIGVQLIETVAKTLFGQQVAVNGTVPEDVATNPKELVRGAVNDIVDIQVGFLSDPVVNFDLDTLIDGAASLEFIVRYARMIDPRVMPVEVIPSNEVVEAALLLFHEKRKTIAAEAPKE